MADKTKKADKAEAPAMVAGIVLSPEQEADALERRAAELRKPKLIEYPKAVRRKFGGSEVERVFGSKAAQEAAGPEWAD